MNLRDKKSELTQPLLQEFKVDILTSNVADNSIQKKDKNGNKFNLSITQLDELVQRIDNCILILNELKSESATFLQKTKERKCDRFYFTMKQILIYLGSVTIFTPLMFIVDDMGSRLVLGVIMALVAIGNIMIINHYRQNNNLRNMQSFSEFVDKIEENEKQYLFNIARELEINPYEYSLIDFIKLFENKKKDLVYQKTSGPCKAAFLIGEHLIYGKNSSVRTLFNNKLFDKNVCDVFFQFAGFTEIPKKEKAERIESELMGSMFLTESFDREKDERIIQEILSFMGLNREEPSPDDHALAKFGLL